MQQVMAIAPTPRSAQRAREHRLAIRHLSLPASDLSQRSAYRSATPLTRFLASRPGLTHGVLATDFCDANLSLLVRQMRCLPARVAMDLKSTAIAAHAGSSGQPCARSILWMGISGWV